MPSVSRRQFCGAVASAAVAGSVLTQAASQVVAQDKASKPEDIPETYQVKFDTSKGEVIIEVHRAWAPIGAARFYDAVKIGFYDDTRFFRVVPDFMVQFGINGDPKVQSKWRDAKIKDDKVTQSNKKGYITFATSGPNSRTSQVFINFSDNSFLDRMGFAPFGQVVEGMDVVEKINAQYGESPDQSAIQTSGNAYLTKKFPELTYIKKATIVVDEKKSEEK